MIAQSTEVTQHSRILEFSENERIGSAISPDIWAANTRIISPNDTDGETGLPLPYTLLLYGGQGFSRFSQFARNSLDGRWGFLRSGGVWFPGYKQGDQLWGQFKPVTPRRDPKKPDKKIKYEAPPNGKNSSGLFLPDIPPTDKIFHNAGIQVATDTSRIQKFKWLAESGYPLIITEGAKKCLATISVGFPSVSLPGTTMGDREGTGGDRTLIPELREILDLGWKDIYIAFDQDPKSKTLQQTTAYANRLKTLIEKAIGGKCRVLKWDGAKGKGIDDYLVGGGNIPSLIEDSQHFLKNEWIRHLRLSYPTIPINCDPYFPSIPLPPQKLICLKAPKGTGKTELMAKWKDSLGEGESLPVELSIGEGENLPVGLSHRVQLGEDICRRFGIPFNNSMTPDDRKYAKYLGFGLCVDSLLSRSKMRWEDGDWLDNAVVFIDEIEQFIHHLLTSDTLKGKRAEVLGNLAKLLKRAKAVIIADADLSDLSVDFIKHQMGIDDGNISIIQGIASPKPQRKAVFYNDPSPLLSDIISRLKRGEKGMLATGAQKIDAQTSAGNFAALIQKKCPDKKILVIDAETVANPDRLAYGVIGKGFGTLGDYDLVIATPVIETGVDLNPNKLPICWDFVGGVGYGVQSPEQFCQGLERYRGDCHRLVFVPKVSSGCFLQNGGEIFVTKIKYSLADFSQCLDTQSWGFLGGAIVSYSRLIARGNLGRKCYREAIQWILSEGNYSIHTGRAVSSEDKLLWEELKNIRKERAAAKISQIDAAEDIPKTKARILEEQRARTEGELDQLARYQVKEKFGTINPDVIAADWEGAYPALRLHYLCLGGIAAASDTPPDDADADREMGGDYLPDKLGEARRKLRAAAISRLGILGLIGQSFRAADLPQIIPQLANIRPGDVERIFGQWQGRDPIMGRLRVIARSLGFDLKSHRRRVGGKAERIYSLIPKWPAVDRAAIFEFWETQASPPISGSVGGVGV